MLNQSCGFLLFIVHIVSLLSDVWSVSVLDMIQYDESLTWTEKLSLAYTYCIYSRISRKIYDKILT